MRSALLETKFDYGNNLSVVAVYSLALESVLVPHFSMSKAARVFEQRRKAVGFQVTLESRTAAQSDAFMHSGRQNSISRC